MFLKGGTFVITQNDLLFRGFMSPPRFTSPHSSIPLSRSPIPTLFAFFLCLTCLQFFRMFGRVFSDFFSHFFFFCFIFKQDNPYTIRLSENQNALFPATHDAFFVEQFALFYPIFLCSRHAFFAIHPHLQYRMTPTSAPNAPDMRRVV